MTVYLAEVWWAAVAFADVGVGAVPNFTPTEKFLIDVVLACARCLNLCSCGICFDL